MWAPSRGKSRKLISDYEKVWLKIKRKTMLRWTRVPLDRASIDISLSPRKPVMKEVIHNPLGISTLTPSEPGVSLMAESWANYHVQSLPCLVPGRDVYQRTKRECDPLGSSDAQSSKRLAIHPGDK
jgi:hypothetical protein